MKDKWIKAQKGDLTVWLDTELTPDLIHEGIANDIKRTIQILRKKRNYEINDRIRVWIWTDNIADIEHVCGMAKTKILAIDRNYEKISHVVHMIPLPYTVDYATTYKSEHSLEFIRIAISKFSDYLRRETLCNKIYVFTNNVTFNCLRIAVEKVCWTNKGDN